MESFLIKVRNSIYKNSDWTIEQIKVILSTLIVLSGKHTLDGPIIKKSAHEIKTNKNASEKLNLNV